MSLRGSNRSRNLGERVPRLDGIAKATGRYVYGSDIVLPGMLFGRAVRSTVAHGLVGRIDTSRAKALPGVRAVVTAADLLPHRYGVAIKDIPLLAGERVLHVGQPVALVAAISLELAEEAAALVAVDYEELPGVFDAQAALEAGAPVLHPGWATYACAPNMDRGGNVAGRCGMRFGDVEAAFSQAHRVYEHVFTTPMIHAGYTEPRVATASWDGAGTLTVWSNAQTPFEVRSTLSDILGLPESRIRVVIPGIGGGFGGKLRIGVDHFAAVLARHCGRPVRVISTCEEEMTAAHPRQPSRTRLRTAVDADGHILARSGGILLDCGAFAGSGPRTAGGALNMLIGPYRVPAFDLEGVAVYTNNLPTGSFRAPAGPMANFAVESQMDMIAADLGLCPLELRLRNVMREGETGPAGETLKGVSIAECLHRAAEAVGFDERLPEPGRAKGISCSWWTSASIGSSGVFVKIEGDGRIVLTSGAVELGTGALTGAAQILAEELGVDAADVSVTTVDTQASPYDFGAQGSRTTFSVGNACRAAAEDLRNQIFAAAERRLDRPAAQMLLREGRVVCGERSIDLGEIARDLERAGGGLIGRGTAISQAPAYDASRFRNHSCPVIYAPSFHAHAVDLSVDAETGEVTVHRYVVAQDVGFTINPTYAEGQIEGGVVQGLGQALSEELVVEAGRIRNPNLTDYKMPTAPDVPPIVAILVENPGVDGPHGAKGIGEPPVIAVPAAVANAVAAVVGRWCRSLPITAEKVFFGLHGPSDQWHEPNGRRAADSGMIPERGVRRSEKVLLEEKDGV